MSTEKKLLAKKRLKEFVRDIPDFPKPGIIFKDITPLLQNALAFESTIDLLADCFAGREIDQIVGIESRGFIFAAALALHMKKGFVPVRKKGKLPWKTHRVSYQLEYGEDVLEIHQDAVWEGARILLIDDVLATGGTAQAVTGLIQKVGGIVTGVGVVIELGFLNGRDKLNGLETHSLIQY